jgi:hypothetical protein
VSFSSGRDLLPPERAAVQPLVRQAIGAARVDLAGLDLGWERERTLESRIEFRPMVTSWLRPGIGYTARFRGDRNATYWEPLVIDDDTTATLQRHFQADRRITRSLALDPEALGRELEALSPDGGAGVLATALRRLRPIDLAWSDGMDSHFERETLKPGLGYQFGLGRYDAFRTTYRETAAQAQRRGSFRARGGLLLPLQAQLDIGYLTTNSDAYERGGGRYTFDERSWPDLILNWGELPVPTAVRGIISRSSATLGYQRTSWVGRPAGAEAAGARTGDEVNLPLSFAIGFANGLSGSYTMLQGEGRAGDLTGSTEQEVSQHAVQLAGSFTPSGSWRESLEGPVRVALSFSTHSRRQCRIPALGAGVAECVPFVDLVNRQLALTLDTMISQLNVGFQMSYNDRKSFVGLHSGSSQFQLGLFGEFNFEAGNFRGGGR